MNEPDLRRLHLEYLHHPRQAGGPLSDWEFQRGYRLRVVDEQILVLTLGPTVDSPASEPPAAPLSKTPNPGEESLVLLLAPRRIKNLERALELPRQEGWTPGAVLILSDDRQLELDPGARREAKRKAREFPWLCVWVHQWMPPTDFFNPEQVLHQLGRISRRISRRVRWRRRLPF